MLSKNKIKLINSLKIKKYREKHGFFVSEGLKSNEEFLKAGFVPVIAVITDEANKFPAFSPKTEIIKVSSTKMKKVSNFKTPSDLLVVYKMQKVSYSQDDISNNVCLFCDDIQDPGNFGTILRTAAWFGIRHVFCSHQTVDVYNHKVIQASMGATASISVHYVDASEFLTEQIKNSIPVAGACLDGENIYQTKLPKNALIVAGNEGKGISPNVSKFLTQRLHIPHFSDKASKPESLNVSIATAIICSEFKRR
ncbi:MAG: TrmH family RNA methyltransferase [Bacteroidota bacterium]|nr:TrmH family RNA methyltransferase [Bacteroidota bacterium]